MNANRNLFLLLIMLVSVSMLFLSCVNPLAYMEDREDVQDISGGSEDDEETEEEIVEASRILVVGDSFSLAWDDSEEGEASAYRVYYRTHGGAEWTMLTEIEETETAISTDDLEYGEYDFAVTALYSEGESDYHTSLDTTAMPNSGWYLDWQEG